MQTTLKSLGKKLDKLIKKLSIRVKLCDQKEFSLVGIEVLIDYTDLGGQGMYGQ